MNEDVNTTNRQIQEQKTTVHSGTQHWIGEVLKYGFLFFLVVVGVLVFIWVFGGDNGRYTVIGLLFAVACIGLYFVYHVGEQTYWKTRALENDSHFHDVSPLLSIGDKHTEGYNMFYVPQFQENVVEDVQDEPMALPRNATSITTLSQQREKMIQDKYYDGGMTMQEIVKAMAQSSIFDPPTLHDVRKALGKTGKEKEIDTS